MRRFCPKCREWKNTEEKFCNKCGTELQGASKFASREKPQNDSSDTAEQIYNSPNPNSQEPLNNPSSCATHDDNKEIADNPKKTEDSNQTSASVEQLKVKVGIYTECSYEESSNYEKKLKDGKQIPSNIEKIKGFFYRKDVIPPDEQQLYVMMRISKDLHFIRTVIQTIIILSVIAAVLIPIIMNMGK